ncbi:MAG: OmpA family protein [Pseudorhodoplanes sp.]|nr:OmpA family protein [Pseudorhodoplanes sp.]
MRRRERMNASCQQSDSLVLPKEPAGKSKMKTKALLLATTILSAAIAIHIPHAAFAQGSSLQTGDADKGNKKDGGKNDGGKKDGGRQGDGGKQGDRGKQGGDGQQGNRGKPDNDNNKQGNRGKQDNDNRNNDRKRAEERQREERQKAEDRQRREDRQRAEDRQKRDDRQKAEEQNRREREERQKAEDRQRREDRQRAEDRQKRDDRQKAEEQDRRDRQDSRRDGPFDGPRLQTRDSKDDDRKRDDRKADDRDRWRRIDDVRRDRREERRGDSVIIHEGNRTIVREGDRWIIRRDEADRFRRNPDARVERRGNDVYTTIIRPDGSRIVTVTDRDGRLIRRVRRDARGREYVLIDNVYRGPRRDYRGFVVVLPPPVIRIPRDRYIVDAGLVGAPVIYETLIAPPVERIERRYTLDEVRYSAPLRDRMPRVDLDTITFDSGSWEVTPDQVDRLAPIADGIKRAIEQNPNEVFLIEGHTDATGSDEDNLSLSDRRAESVALVLTEQFGIPPENLTTQGYGEQQLKVPTDGPERANRRVTVRRITPLLTGENQPPAQ